MFIGKEIPNHATKTHSLKYAPISAAIKSGRILNLLGEIYPVRKLIYFSGVGSEKSSNSEYDVLLSMIRTLCFNEQ